MKKHFFWLTTIALCVGLSSFVNTEEEKTIMLMRHAYAPHGMAGNNDLMRELDEQGILEATKTGKFMLLQNLTPDLIVSSYAPRAMKTTEIIAKEMHVTAEKIGYDSLLYMCKPEQILATIQAVDNAHNSILIIGHNPSITQCLNQLRVGKAIPDVKPCTLVVLKVKTNVWSQVVPGSAEMEFMTIPENINDDGTLLEE